MKKVVDINPITRLKKQGLEELIAHLQRMDPEKLESLVLFYQYGDGFHTHFAGGLDFALMGYMDATTTIIKDELLMTSSVDIEDLEDPIPPTA